MPHLVPVCELNRLPADRFAEALGPLFEAADPLAKLLYAHRPVSSYEQLIDTAEQLTNVLEEAGKIAVANAHPRIGES
ncbi:MAG: hypothetical protein JOZ81_30520, partial [Chloroflexi bacterium]|nr:hypothetical protein [Chloroflexota bacterium]